MRLKVHYDLDTFANDQRFDLNHKLDQTLGNYNLSFNFDNEHNLKGVEIYVPNATVNRDSNGSIVPLLTEDKETEIYELVNYISNVLWKQTGKCSFSRRSSPEYVPETEQERLSLQRRTITRTLSLQSNVCIRAQADMSETAMSRYLAEKDALAMFADASKMTNSTGKFREFFRIIDHYFPIEGEELDRQASNYLIRFNPQWNQDLIRKLRRLRNRCSHAKRRRDYITSGNLGGQKEIEENLGVLRQITEALINNPPP